MVSAESLSNLKESQSNSQQFFSMFKKKLHSKDSVIVLWKRKGIKTKGHSQISKPDKSKQTFGRQQSHKII